VAEDSRQASAECKVTPKMVQAAAEVILERAGDEWTRIDWATAIAEAALEAAFLAECQARQPS
jgi:hypothetical protein